MDILKFVVSNWLIIVIMVAGAIVGGYSAYSYIKRPTSEQMEKLKEWLLYAVTEAEKELGSGTGRIKLRYVYDMFIVKFPFLASYITFENFSILVDEVLEQFRELIDSNEKVKNYIEN